MLVRSMKLQAVILSAIRNLADIFIIQIQIYIVPQEFRTTSSGVILTCRLNFPFPEFLTSDQIMFATLTDRLARGFRRQVTGEYIRSNPTPSSIEIMRNILRNPQFLAPEELHYRINKICIHNYHYISPVWRTKKFFKLHED